MIVKPGSFRHRKELAVAVLERVFSMDRLTFPEDNRLATQFHRVIQPGIRPSVKITVNMLTGMPMAFSVMPE